MEDLEGDPVTRGEVIAALRAEGDRARADGQELRLDRHLELMQGYGGPGSAETRGGERPQPGPKAVRSVRDERRGGCAFDSGSG
eukprot:3347589-Pyramimonas_sp.AAC.1